MEKLKNKQFTTKLRNVLRDLTTGSGLLSVYTAMVSRRVLSGVQVNVVTGIREGRMRELGRGEFLI